MGHIPSYIVTYKKTSIVCHPLTSVFQSVTIFALRESLFYEENNVKANGIIIKTDLHDATLTRATSLRQGLRHDLGPLGSLSNDDDDAVDDA